MCVGKWKKLDRRFRGGKINYTVRIYGKRYEKTGALKNKEDDGMRRIKVVAAAAMTACLAVGSVSMSWAWQGSGVKNGEKTPLDTSTITVYDAYAFAHKNRPLKEETEYCQLWNFKTDETLLIEPDAEGGSYYLAGYLVNKDRSISLNGDADFGDPIIWVPMGDFIREPAYFDLCRMAETAVADVAEWGDQVEDYRFRVWCQTGGGEWQAMNCFIYIGDAAGSAGGDWYKEGEKWKIYYPDGECLTSSWYLDPASGLWYYLDENGYMLHDTWFVDRSRNSPASYNVVYLLSDGHMAVNQWVHDPVSGLWGYVGEEGALEIGEVKDSSMWSLAVDSSLCAGMQAPLKNAWYEDTSCKSFAHGNKYVSQYSTWYYFDANGKMLKNTWFQSPGSGLWYYFGSEGEMYADCDTPDGFTVNADGVWVQ